MAAGGSRKGAGRPKMTAAEKKRAAFMRLQKASGDQMADKTIGLVPDGDEPVHVRFLRATVESPLTPDDVRMKAAMELAKIDGAAKDHDGGPTRVEKLGKKEQARVDAAESASGRYAPARPPRPKLTAVQ